MPQPATTGNFIYQLIKKLPVTHITAILNQRVKMHHLTENKLSVDNRRRILLRGLLAMGILVSIAPSAATLPAVKTIKDIAGRTVRINTPIKRILLANGSLAYSMALLRQQDPFGDIIGLGKDFRDGDSGSWQVYSQQFPQIKQIPMLPAGTLQMASAEQIIRLLPDVVIMNLSSRPVAESSAVMSMLEQAAIPIIFTDFRQHIMANSGKSIAILGELLDARQTASEFLQFRQQQIQRITQPLAGIRYKPRVILERAPGIYPDCCLSYGNANLGELVNIAGGDNIGGHFISGTFGQLNPEQIIAADPDIILLTGANWSAWSPQGSWINLGPAADPSEGLPRLHRLIQRPVWKTLRAVNNGQVYAIWHTFYDNPCNFIALQYFAKWLHPELFTTLDPDATFRELHQRFLPIPYQAGYWLSLRQ